jgi:hypothetical protein
MQNLRKKVVRFIRTEYRKSQKVPSVREICRALGLDNKTLYEAFPGGKPEMCAEANVPLDEESLATVEKASLALREKRIEEKTANAELDALRKEEEEIFDETQRVQMTIETKRRIKECEFQLASTPEGRKHIFSDPKRMRQFAARTIDYENLVLENPKVWDSFVNYCRSHGLDLAKTLFQIAGSLKDYETDPDKEELHNYLGFKLGIFLEEREAEQKQKIMQAKFDDFLEELECDECGRGTQSMYLDGNCLRCPCGRNLDLTCTSCHGKLLYDSKKNSFNCQRCNMVFTTKLLQIDRTRFLLL